MAMDNATRHSGHYRVSGWLKSLAIVLGLMAVGFVAITVANDHAPPQSAVVAPAVQRLEATAADTTAVPDERLLTVDRLSDNPIGKIDSPTSAPRECRPDQGIVNDCTFD